MSISSNLIWLLKNYDKLYSHHRKNIFIPAGYFPMYRPIKEHLAYGCINLDKPISISSPKIVKWMKKIIGFKNIGHSEILDSIIQKDSGTLILYIGKTRRLNKTFEFSIKEYICITRFYYEVDGGTVRIAKSVENLIGALFQRYISFQTNKKFLSIKTIYQIRPIEYHKNQCLAVFLVSCEKGCNIQSLLFHVGMLLGLNSRILEIRRIRSSVLIENDNMVTMHDVLDAMWLFCILKDESYIRRVVMPLEILVNHLKRLVVKDSAINSLCYGAKLMIPGLFIFDSGINLGDEIIIMTLKGEAIAIGIAKMNTAMMLSSIHGTVMRIKRVIMERNTYPKRW